MRVAVLAFAVCLSGAACGTSSSSSPPNPAPDASTAPDDASVIDASPPDAGVEELCQLTDVDRAPTVPALARTPICKGTLTPDDAAPLFSDVGTLPADYTALHALCARMNPAPGTIDTLTDATLDADVRAYLTTLLDRPPLARALAGVPQDERLATVASVWLDLGGFEHVLCGDLNPNGNVGGLHLWSEYYQAEREGRADYACTVQPDRDGAVATFAYRWRPPGKADTAPKPLGSFVVGMSPACLLAVGVRAVTSGVEPRPGDQAAFRARLYGVEREWVLGVTAGSIITLYPHGEP